MRVLLHYDAGPALTARAAALAGEGLDVEVVPVADAGRFEAALASAEVIWHVLAPIRAAHIDAAPRLRLIQKIGVGVNTIDVETAAARGVAVCNMPGTNSRAVAELALMLMLAALRRAAQLDRETRAGAWWRSLPDIADRLGELGGRTVGLVGFGAVPRILAPILTAMGARVLYTARAPKPGAPAAWRDLDDLLGESDVVSLHVPLTEATANLIDARAIARMRPGAVLINTARGELVEEAALVEALEARRLSAAGLDVFAAEPAAAGSALFALDQVAVTPHVAWLTAETWARSLDVAVGNCRRLERAEALAHRVA